MKRIYSANNLIEASLLRDLLEHAGIAAHVFNANATSVVGECPVDSALPQVWIVQDHQAQPAQAVVADFLSRRSMAKEQFCHVCGESNPGEFELCWQCGNALPVRL